MKGWNPEMYFLCWYLLLQYCTDNRILYRRQNIVRTTDSRGAAAQYMLSRRRLLHNIASSHITLHCPVHITFLVDLVQSFCDFNTSPSSKISKTISVKYQRLFPMWQIFTDSLGSIRGKLNFNGMKLVASLNDLPRVFDYFTAHPTCSRLF